jgi:superfamily II DNA helicase RecQ
MDKKKAKIMSMMLFADTVYKCRQQLAYQPFLWPDSPMIPECHNCDNCREREKDIPNMCDVTAEALRLVKIVKALLHHVVTQDNITRDDVVDVFYGNKNNNVVNKDLMQVSEYPSTRPQTKLRPKKMCLYLLDSLIDKGIIIQAIDLQRIRPESSILTYSCKIIGVCENAEAFVSSKVYQQFLK